MANTKVRVSIGNLVRLVSNGRKLRTAFGVLNPKKLAKGERFVQALGGRANLTPLGKEILERQFGAEGFELDENSGMYDAAFIAPEESLEGIFKFFEDANPDHFELDPAREIEEEVFQKIYPNEIGTILPASATRPVITYVKTVHQPVPDDGKGTSSRARDDMPTRRIFRVFDLVFSERELDDFLLSEAVIMLSEAELMTTKGGRSKGLTMHGETIADNLGL